MSLTNPNKLINVQELAYFEGKIGDKYAAKTAVSNKADKVGTGHGDEIALFNNNGNLKTSDKKLSDFAAAEHTHTKSEITDFSHTHDDRYYQKSQVYTTAETQQYVNQRVGLEYDAENRCVTFPASSVAKYDSSSRSINFPALTL